MNGAAAVDCPARAEGCTDDCTDLECAPAHVAALRAFLEGTDHA